MYMYIMISFRLPSLTGLDPGRPRSWELLQALTSHAPWRPRIGMARWPDLRMVLMALMVLMVSTIVLMA